MWRAILLFICLWFVNSEGLAMRPPATANSPETMEEIEAELRRRGIRPIRGGSSNEIPDPYPDFEFIERKSRFLTMGVLIQQLRVLRMTGIDSLIQQVAGDIVHLVLQETDPVRIGRSDALLLGPLRALLDEPESQRQYDAVYHGYRKLWSEERARHRREHGW